MTPSQSLAETLSAHGLKKPVSVMRNFIDTDLFRPAEAEEKAAAKKYFGIADKSVVYMGRLSYEKSIDQVVKAFALMLKKSPDLKLMLIGGGPEKEKLEKLAAELDIRNKIIFTGFLFGENLVKALWANDVFLTASKSENMPLSVLEAMASGLALVMVREKGLAELIRTKENGFFAETNNPEDMARKTLALISNENLAADFGRASRALAMEYSQEKVCKSLEEHYLKILENGKIKK
jgi:glycosyltransferase EpsD